MANTALLQVRIDPATKQAVDKIFASEGLDTPTAIRMFLTRTKRDGEFPYELRHVHHYSQARLDQLEKEAEEALRDSNTKVYKDADEWYADVLSREGDDE